MIFEILLFVGIFYSLFCAFALVRFMYEGLVLQITLNKQLSDFIEKKLPDDEESLRLIKSHKVAMYLQMEDHKLRSWWIFTPPSFGKRIHGTRS